MPTSRQLNNNQKQHLMSTAHQNVLIESIKKQKHERCSKQSEGKGA
jgi:hypothetical protein